MEHILFVDPFASAKFLATSLRNAGVTTSVVYTMTKLQNDYLNLHPEMFDHAWYLNDVAELPALIQDLKAKNVTRVYYGCEMSIALADQIANAVCPRYANDTATTTYRLDKFEMQEALRLAGLPHIKQIKTTNALTAEQEKLLASWEFPVIVKPVNCNGSLGVECCHSIEEVKAQLLKQANTNLFGQAVDTYLVQEYLKGTEYIVDTFSVEGQHQLSGTLRTCRSLYESNPICLYSEYVSPDETNSKLCVEYTKNVLTALGLKNGFAHTEVMLTDRGPILIEVNPRISGAHGYVNKLFQACGAPAQVDLLIQSCRNQTMPPVKKGSYGRRVCLQNYVKRHIKDLNLSLLKKLPSFVEANMMKAPGSLLTKPKSLIDTVAFVLLAHPDHAQVEKDHAQLLDWEKGLQLF